MSRGPVPPTLDDVKLCASRMAANAADAVTLVSTFSDLISRLQPAESILRSRPHFERGALWSYPALFEFVNPFQEPPMVVLKAQTDLWVRGVNATVIVGQIPPEGMEIAPILFYVLSKTYGSNSRYLVECKWRLDSAQGFISRGTSETYAPAPLITGDGEFNAPLDWVIEKDQTIEVNVRSLVAPIFGSSSNIPKDELPSLRAVYITFWGEDMRGCIGAGRVLR